MGWTSTNKPSYMSTVEYFNDMFTSEYHTVLDSALVERRTYYAAVQFNDTKEVFAAIVLVRFNRGYHNLSYKDMDEGAGPCEIHCPERILKLLTPTDAEYALNWRKACMKRINKRKNNPKLKRGMVIRFKHPKLFSSSTHDTFIVLNPKSSVFSGAYCARSRFRITNFRDDEYEVVGQYLQPDNLPTR